MIFQVDESTLPVIDNEKRRVVRGYVWSVVNVMTGDRFFFYKHSPLGQNGSGQRDALYAGSTYRDLSGFDNGDIVLTDGVHQYSDG